MYLLRITAMSGRAGASDLIRIVLTQLTGNLVTSSMCIIVDLVLVMILFGIDSGQNRSSNGSIRKKRFAFHQVDQMRRLFPKGIVMIEIIYGTASVTDRLAELCIGWCRSLSVLMGRMLFMIVIHAYRQPSTVSPAYAMLSYRSNALLEYFTSRVLKLNINQFLLICPFGRSLSVSSLGTHTAFCSLSCKCLSQCSSCLLRLGFGGNLFGIRCLVSICIVSGETFHLLLYLYLWWNFAYYCKRYVEVLNPIYTVSLIIITSYSLW